jgi:HSP20 family protein
MANGYLTPWRGGSLTRSPFGTGSLFDLHRQMNRLFDDILESPAGSLGAPVLAATSWPQLEIEQKDDQIRVVAELPGVDEKDVELTIEDGVLSLTGEKRSERKDESGYSERSYGRFERRIALPTNIDEDKCKADFRNGVLTVTIPRAAEKARGRKIPLGTGGQQQARRIEAANEPESMPRQQAAEESRNERRSTEGQQE